MKELPISREDSAERLHQCGLGVTLQRLEIAQVLFSRRQHLTAEQILKAVNARNVIASKATVYNTLKLFVRHGLVREVVIDPSRVVYDSVAGPHHHLYDVDTGELTDIPADEISVSGLPQLPDSKVLERIDIVLRVRSAAKK